MKYSPSWIRFPPPHLILRKHPKNTDIISKWTQENLWGNNYRKTKWKMDIRITGRVEMDSVLTNYLYRDNVDHYLPLHFFYHVLGYTHALTTCLHVATYYKVLWMNVAQEELTWTYYGALWDSLTSLPKSQLFLFLIIEHNWIAIRSLLCLVCFFSWFYILLYSHLLDQASFTA